MRMAVKYLQVRCVVCTEAVDLPLPLVWIDDYTGTEPRIKSRCPNCEVLIERPLTAAERLTLRSNRVRTIEEIVTSETVVMRKDSDLWHEFDQIMRNV